MSLTRAAEQLHVTPAAVSHQIRLLEKDLGVNLFERKGRAIVPTPAALAGMAEFAQGFRPSRRGCAAHAREPDGTAPEGHLGADVCRQLAGATACPVPLEISGSRRPYRRLGPPLSISTARSSISGYAGAAAATRALPPKKLFDEEVFPVCHHALLQGEHAIREPSDLRRHTLIHLDWAPEKGFWPTWENGCRRRASILSMRGVDCASQSMAMR